MPNWPSFPAVLAWSLVMASTAGPALAQDLAAVRLDRDGTLVRVYTTATSAPPIEGSVRRLGADDILVIGTGTGHDVDVPRGTITRVEFSTGRRGHPWWGVVAGAFVMGIPGAIYWNRECEGSCRAPALEGFALGALSYGIVPGFVIGSLIRTHDWRLLPLAYLDSAVGRRPGPRIDLQLALAPARGGGLSLALRLSMSPNGGRRRAPPTLPARPPSIRPSQRTMKSP